MPIKAVSWTDVTTDLASIAEDFYAAANVMQYVGHRSDPVES